MQGINRDKQIMYSKEDCVIIVDLASPYESMIGVIKDADNELMRYYIDLGSSISDYFRYNQIAHYRTKDELKALLDLALDLGPAAKEMFEDWLLEYKVRYGNQE